SASATGRCHRRGRRSQHPQARVARRRHRQGGVPFVGRGFLSHQPDRARLRRDGGMLGDRGRRNHHDGGGAGIAIGFDEVWTAYLWPLIIIVAQSVLLLVVLLIAIAYVLLADRKIWAAVQIRRGPNVVGPWGLLQSFADLLKFVVKEPTIPAGANKGVFLL